MLHFRQNILSLLLVASSSSLGVVSFVPPSTQVGIQQFQQRSAPRQLNVNDDDTNEQRTKQMVGGATAFITGLVVATQVAFADPSTVVDTTTFSAPTSTQSSTVLLSAFGAPSFSGGASFETLDFSLPSYNEATKSSSSSDGSSSAPPSFMPNLPELKLPENSATASVSTTEEKGTADKKAEEEASAKKAAEEEKAAAKKAAEEEKAAKLKAKEEERLAKEKEAEEKAAAAEKKKAELEARKEAERQKQEEMVRRNKEAAEKAAAEAAKQEAVIEVTLPPSPAPAALSVPDAPALPELKVPEFSAPDIKLPSFSVPKFDAPKFEAPKFDIPAAPKLETPKFDIPSAPSIPSTSTFSVPPVVVDAPPPVPKAPLEPQDVRDARAREAKNKFKELDAEAREVEKQAKIARDIASVAKKEAGEAKAEACETRPGGKFVCIRPFGIGY